MSKQLHKCNKPHTNTIAINQTNSSNKTTLTAALEHLIAKKNGTISPSLENIHKIPEEKVRGITINSMDVDYKTDISHLTHEDYVKKMIIGAAQMDNSIETVAAIDGTMPYQHKILFDRPQLWS